MIRALPFRQLSGKRGRTPGFTLLELMIVLALLTFLVAIAWPALRRPLLRCVTQQAAQQLVDDLSKARLTAIESGQTLAMRFEPGGSRYNILPAEPRGEGEQVEEYLAETIQPLGLDEESDPTAGLRNEMKLDDDVVFRDLLAIEESEVFGDSALGDLLRDEMQETKEVETLVDHGKVTSESWSGPVLFYPTGRAENAEFVLQGPGGYSVTVTLRGLTGALTIGPLQHPIRVDEFHDEIPTDPASVGR